MEPPQVMELEPAMAAQARRKFYGDKRFSDFTVICHGTEYHVHRVLVATQSKWFEACCTAFKGEVEYGDDLSFIKGAVFAVYQQVELPESDRTLKTVVLEAWVSRRKIVYVESELRQLLKDVPEIKSMYEFLNPLRVRPDHCHAQRTMENLQAAAAASYGDDKFSDFIIVCDGKEYKVHRFIICAHSEYFKRVCTSAFMEASQQKIELKEDLPQAIKCMIEYFYKLDYDDFEGVPESRNEADNSDLPWIKEPQFAMQLNAYIYAVAEKYEVIGLKALALDKLKQQAARVDLSTFRRLAWTARTVYLDILLPEHDRSCHSLLVDVYLLHAGGVVAQSNFDIGVYLELISRRVPEFALNVATKLMSGFKRNRMWTQCPRCMKRQETVQSPTDNQDCSACQP
ncbi:uncharacterized protein MYCFIDRAFT_80991, partial [Pseudocercospora fijiensis CIRAD86]